MTATDLAGVTIAPGDDTACDRCGHPLPAGAPAWPVDGGVNCADCADCPDHGLDFAYVRSDGGEEYWACPAGDCTQGRWIS